MAKKQKHNKKKWLTRLLFLGLFVGAVIVTYFVWDAYFNDKKDDTTSEQWATEKKTEAQVDTRKNEEKENNQETTSDDNPQKTEQFDGEDPNTAEQLSGAITHAGVENDRLVIRLNIDQYLEEGECRLTLKQDGNVIHDEVTGIISNASTATCEGFDIPVVLVGNGHLNMEININAGEKSGVITGEVDI